MQPLGRKPIRFPGKLNLDSKGFINWWEEEEATSENKKASRRQSKKYIQNELKIMGDYND